LKALDIIVGSSVPGQPGLYVLGCYDDRITFFSQQVRAINLVWALNEQQYLSHASRIAVIGGGAAGVTAAAAIALVTEQVNVDLFEFRAELLDLQSISTRRSLDPHIYGWPDKGSTLSNAELPILDWRAGPVQDVRNSILRDFLNISSAVGQRLKVRTRHKVTALSRVSNAFQTTIIGSTELPETAQYDVVLLSFGFGTEPSSVNGMPVESYWSDAGIPEKDLSGASAPRFIVSGSGDGSLIDLVAAATKTFDHAGMIHLISRFPGIDKVAEELVNIDVEARKKETANEKYDLKREYDLRVLPKLNEIGILAAVEDNIRPDLKLILQTRSPSIFNLQTSILNRLAAYMVVTIYGTKSKSQRAANQAERNIAAMTDQRQSLRQQIDRLKQDVVAAEAEVSRATERVSEISAAISMKSAAKELENLAADEALLSRRLQEAQAQLNAREAEMESARKNAAAIEAQWKASGMGGFPNAASLTKRRTEIAKEVEEVDLLLTEQARLVEAYQKALQNDELKTVTAQLESIGGSGAASNPRGYEATLNLRLQQAEDKHNTSESAKATVSALAETLQKAASDFSTRFLLPLNDLIDQFNEALLSYPGETIRFKASHHLNRTQFDMQLRYRDQIDDAIYNTDLPPQIVLSEGQLAANGFSILCAASVAYPWSRWKALLLDDPLQHNDIIHAAAFVDLMRNLVERKGYQLLMSSHERSEAEFISRKFDAAGIPCSVLELTAPSKTGVSYIPARYNEAAKAAMQGS